VLKIGCFIKFKLFYKAINSGDNFYLMVFITLRIENSPKQTFANVCQQGDYWLRMW